MCFRLKEGKLDILWPICILKYCLPIICCTFFGQIFLLSVSVFECRNGKIYFDENVACKSGDWFYYDAPISIIVMIIQIILSYLTISMSYQADFIIEGNDLLKKRSSIPDIIFLFCKIIIIIIFVFDKEEEYEHWGILFVLCLITGINTYYFFFLQNYENKIINKFHSFFNLSLFWGFLCLFISNIFKSLEFGGGFYLFIFGIIIIFIYCLFYTKIDIEFLHFNFNDMNTCQDCINYINAFLKVIKEKEISRDSSLFLTSFIEKTEERCSNNNCILKKYLESLSKGFDSNFLLLQYAQKLFKIALIKYPNDITLRLHYIIFLIAKINQKKNAEKELFSIKSNYFFINHNFNIYRCKKYIEEYNSIDYKNQEEGIESSDIFQLIEYKNNSKEFRRLLSKSSSLYYDFWTSLYNSHLQGTEDFKKLNDIGVKLNQLIEDIEIIFKKLQEIKKNDLVIIKLYESYLKNILNDKEKYEKYYNISMNLITDKIENRELDYTNYDLKILNENDEYKYLVISANDENKGTIINLSLNSCSIFGYNKSEIIGKHMNILIPEIYHKIHDKKFNEHCENTKIEFFENLSNKIIYKPKFIEIPVFGRNKSKYLIPLELKVFFVQTDESELVYLIDISNKNKFHTQINEDDENDKTQLCFVLTNNNLIIQTFTSNCVELLGLNSNIINSNCDITSFIKQFNDELQTIITNSNKDFLLDISENKSIDNSLKEFNSINHMNDDKSFENKIKFKQKLLKLQYSHPRKITWEKNIDIKKTSEIKFQSDIRKSQISLFAPQINKKKSNIIHKNFLMEVKEAHISQSHIGYYFIFKKLQLLNELNHNNLKKVKLGNSSSRRKSSKKLFYLEEESFKTIRTYNKEDETSLLHNSTLRKLSNDDTKRTNLVSFDSENENNTKKYDSAKTINVYDDNDNIDCKYIPKCNFNFLLDLETMSFKPSTKIDSCQELYNVLRRQSLEKLSIIYQAKKKYKKINSSSLTSDSENSSRINIYYSSESNSSSYISSSYSKSSENSKKIKTNIYKRKNIKRKGGIIEKSIFNSKCKNNNNNINKNDGTYRKKNYEYNGEYYKVNINKIKLMIYDFNSGTAIEDKNEKKSQVEITIENYKSKKNINISEDSNYTNISFEKYTATKRNKKNNNNEKKLIKNEIENIIDKEKEFEKEISIALSKKDEQKVIILFYKISFIFMIIALLMGLFEIYFINYHYLKLKENLNLVINAANLKYFTNFGIYYIKENILNLIKNNITNGIYNVPDSDHNIYKNKIIKIGKKTFSDCNSIFEKIIGSNLELSKDSQYYLNEMPFDIQILYNNNSNIKNSTSTFFTSLIHIFSSLCNILIKFESISIDDPNLFNYFHNSFNNLGNALTKQIELFISELVLRESNIVKYIIIIGCVFLFLHIILSIITYKIYSLIVKKKESYISVFYGIGLSLIMTSIKKCEIFINKINQNDEKTKYKDNDDESNSLDFSSNNNLNNIISENKFDKKKINNNKKQKKLIKNRYLEDDKNSKNFKRIYSISLLLSFLYLILVLFTFLILTSKFITCARYIFYLQNYHNNIIELFNAYREYLFDENNIIAGLPAYKYLIQKEEIFYSFTTQNLIFLIKKNDELNLSSNYIEFQKSGFCNSYISYFNNKEECEEFLGGEDGYINLGFFVIVSSFIEDIRNGRNYMKLLLNNKTLVGNLSNIINNNSNDTTYGLDKNQNLRFRMIVFNLENTHSRLNILFLNVILQYINRERNLTMNEIDTYMTNGHMKYIIFLIIYIFIFLLLFFFYWIPKIRNMNDEIYKTKNMLSIIPPKILASQPNIRQLLNIQTNDD